jgi:glucosyltransferase GtrII-like protein
LSGKSIIYSMCNPQKFVHHYIIFGITASVWLLCSYHPILECYAVTDDYSLLYYSQNEHFFDFIIAGGRPVFWIFAKWLFAKLHLIAQLKYLRLVSLFGIICFSLLLYRAYGLSGWTKLESGSIAIITCLMPAFCIYATWATTFPIAYGACLAFIGGELSLRSYSAFFERPHRAEAAFSMLGSGLLITISLSIYQPISPAFWLFIAIRLFGPDGNSEDMLSQSLFCLAVFSISVLLYFVFYKSAIWPFTIEPLDRSGISRDFSDKMVWFIHYPLSDVLSLFNILKAKRVIRLTIFTVAAIIIFGLFVRILRIKKQTCNFMLIGLCLTLLTYLPNLVAAENWSPFRTQAVLSSLIIFYILLAVRAIFPKNATIIILLVFMLVLSAKTFENINDNIVKSQKKEMALVKGALSKSSFNQKKEIIFVRSHWKDRLVPSAPYDEFGQLSTYQPGAPYAATAMLNLIAREIDGLSVMPIKIHDYAHDQQFNADKDLPIINAGELLRDYKKKMKKTSKG